MKQRYLGALALLSIIACSRSKEAPKESPAAALSGPITPAAPSTRAVADRLATAPAWPVPYGPFLQILPGKGVGPIRFGATVATIERLMGEPCQYKTDNSCRYVNHAVEFFLEDGALVEIRAYRPGRRASDPPMATYGAYNGNLRQGRGVAFGMLPWAVRDALGKPLKTDTIADGGPTHTVQSDEFPGLRVEYDRIENGNLVVGEIVVTKADVK